jgi:hypothetical protein
LKVTGLINVCYDLDDRETLDREVSALRAGMAYFGLKKSTLITAVGNDQTITVNEGAVRIMSFPRWALQLHIE